MLFISQDNWLIVVVLLVYVFVVLVDSCCMLLFFRSCIEEVKMFMWLLHNNQLWCNNDRLQKRGWPNGYFCQLCLRNLETSMHLIWRWSLFIYGIMWVVFIYLELACMYNLNRNKYINSHISSQPTWIALLFYPKKN